MSETRALTRYDGPRTTEQLREYALLLAFDTNPDGQYKRNDALPAVFRGNPGAVAFAVEYGKALDVSPITALIGIHIVDGKPTASAGLISALVRRAGHKIRTWTEGSVVGGDLKGITTITREDDPEFEYRSEWTLERAVRAGLCQLVKTETGWTVTARGRSGKPGGWETYTESMVKARSITEAARDAAEDAILGVHYTPEELGVEVDETGEPVYSVTTVEQQPTPATERPKPTPAPTPAPDTGDAPTGEQLDEVRDLILDATEEGELRALWTGTVIRGHTERAKGLTVGDADGAEVSLFDLMAQAREALVNGTMGELRARFGLVPVTEGDDEPGDPGDGEAGTPAEEPTPGPGAPSSGTAAPEATDAPAEAAQPPVHHAAGVEGPHRRTLNLVADQLTGEQRAAIVEWRAAWEHDAPTEENAAKTCSAIATGQITKLVEVANGPDPREVLAEAQLRVAREVEEEAAERHADAAEAKPAGAGNRQDRTAAARAEARKAAEAARNN